MSHLVKVGAGPTGPILIGFEPPLAIETLHDPPAWQQLEPHHLILPVLMHTQSAVEKVCGV